MTEASPLQGLPDVALRLTAIVTLLVLLVYVYIGLTVSAMRDKYGVAPPAVAGPAEFERAFRAHQNTLESLPGLPGDSVDRLGLLPALPLSAGRRRPPLDSRPHGRA
jgi:hypothetical protein